MTTTNTPSEVRQRLGKAAGDVRAARARLREEQEAAWQRYVTTVESALADDLALPEEAEPAERVEPVHLLLDAVHGRIDDLRVQAQLGRMEAGELLDDLQRAVDWLIDHVKPT